MRKMIKIFSVNTEMKKLYCFICGKEKNFEKPKISFVLEKTLVLSFNCSKCKHEDEKIFK